MRTAARLGLVAVVAASLAVGVVPPSVSAATTPTVITRSADHSLYLSDGLTSSLLRQGRPDVSGPWASSLDGATSLWTIGTTFRQVLLVHAGSVVHVFDDVAQDGEFGDVSADGRFAVVAMEDPSRPTFFSMYYVDVASGAVESRGDWPKIEDLGLTADGAYPYWILSGSPTGSILAFGDSAGESDFPATGSPGIAADATTYVAWSTLSADGSTLALDLVTHATTNPQHEGYVITSRGGNLRLGMLDMRDAGPLPSTGSLGRFRGTELDVAEAGQLLTYTTPDHFGGAPDVTTPMPMTGPAVLILNPGATLGTSFPTPAAIPTFTQPWIAKGSYPVATSTTVYLNSAIPLVPAVQSNAAPWNDLYGYWDYRSCYLLYSVDHGTTWASWPWRSKDFVVTRNVWVRATHATDVNSRASYSAIVQYAAKPYLVVHYTASTRHLYGTANIPTGSIVQVQRRSATGVWSAYYTRVPVTSYAWGVSLPAGHASWRVVVPATSTYVAAVSAVVAS